jgi:hypothetical protein
MLPEPAAPRPRAGLPSSAVDLLPLKLALTPLIVGGSAYAARRWGPAHGGWLIALPLTSGPVAFYLAIEQGPAFAAQTTLGSLVGAIAHCAYVLAYARLAGRGWPAALGVASLAFVAVGAVGNALAIDSPFILLPLVLVALALTLRRLPPGRAARSTASPPRWDLPARTAIGTAIVLAATLVAPHLGPTVSGIVVAFPVFISILTVFTHRHAGPRAAVSVLRGLITGNLGYAAFFTVLDLTLDPAKLDLPVGVAFVAALATVGVVQWFTLRALRSVPETAM